MNLPLPWHFGQVCCMVKKPCDTRTWPAPWQVGQVSTLEPGSAPLPWQWSQSSQCGTRICASWPCAACSSEISML